MAVMGPTTRESVPHWDRMKTAYIYSLSDMNYYSKEIIQAVGVLEVVHGIKQPQVERKCDAIRQFNILLHILLKFEAFKVQSKNVGELLNFHSSREIISQE